MAEVGGRLAGKRAVVTGAASGIGLATLRLFVEEGARVAAADLNDGALQRAIAPLNGRATGLSFDVSSKDAVEGVIAASVNWLGGLDIVVNCAGVGGVGNPARLAEMPDETWQKTLETNLVGTFLVTRACIPHLLAAGGGAIVNLASTYAIVAGPQLAAYAASKGGIVQLTKTVAVDYARDGIRANALAPGFVDTPMLRADIAKEADSDAALSSILARIPQNELMSAEQVARVILFLASDDARVITGSLVIADGGYTAL